MAPNGDAIPITKTKKRNGLSKPPRLSKDSLKRTVSDISHELSKEAAKFEDTKELAPISESEDAKCECCGMVEEYTLEYVEAMRVKFYGKWICGLCCEAVKEEMEKNGGKSKEEALNVHMSVCVRFNKFGRAYPALLQAEAMKEMLRKRAKSISPRGPQKKGGIIRSTSCISAITRDM